MTESADFDAALAQILTSPWLEPSPKLASFFPSGSRLYAMYSPGIDRFIAVDRLDPWAVLHAARLLHSKLPLAVYVLTDEHSTITNANCLKMTIVVKRHKLASLGTGRFRVKVVEDSDQTVEAGPPIEYRDQPELLIREQEFALFVLRATAAMRLTDGLLNDSCQDFYARLFPGLNEIIPFDPVVDYINWPGGFVLNIERILYHSNTINEALEAFSRLFSGAIKRNKGKRAYYAATFSSLMGWSFPS